MTEVKVKEATVPGGLRLTPSDWEEFRARGGVAYLREVLTYPAGAHRSHGATDQPQSPSNEAPTLPTWPEQAGPSLLRPAVKIPLVPDPKPVKAKVHKPKPKKDIASGYPNGIAPESKSATTTATQSSMSYLDIDEGPESLEDPDIEKERQARFKMAQELSDRLVAERKAREDLKAKRYVYRQLEGDARTAAGVDAESFTLWHEIIEGVDHTIDLKTLAESDLVARLVLIQALHTEESNSLAQGTRSVRLFTLTNLFNEAYSELKAIRSETLAKELAAAGERRIAADFPYMGDIPDLDTKMIPFVSMFKSEVKE